MNLSRLALLYPGDHVVAFLVVIVVSVSVISGLALLAAWPLSRRPALRHGILLAGLLCSFLVPAFVTLTELTQRTFIHVNAPFPVASEMRSPVIRPRQLSEPNVSIDLPIATDDSETNSESTRPNRKTAGDNSFSRPGFKSPAVNTGSPSVAATIERPVWFCVTAAAICLTWAIGSICFLVGFVRAFIQTMIVRRSMQPLSQTIHRSAREHVQQTMNLRELPTIAISRLVSTPVVIGIVKAQIVLPQSLIHILTEDEFQEILIHETAHAIRRDLWVVQWEAITKILLWPIPFVTLLARQLSQTREELCDLYVVKTCERVGYGRTLLRVARITMSRRPMALATGILYGPGKLENRIASLLDTDRDESTKVSKRIMVSICAAFLVLTTIASGTRLLAVGQQQNRDHKDPPDAPVVDDISIDDTSDENKVIEKIRLLGGEIERDETLPDRPAKSVTIVDCPRFVDPYMRLLPKLKVVTSVRIHSNQITDQGIVELWKLKNLKTLELHSYQIKGDGLKGIGELKELTTLDLSITPMTDEGIDVVAKGSLKGLEDLKQLTSLNLADTMIEESDRIRWKKLENLKSLACDTQCNDSLLIGVAELKGLTKLQLTYGQLTERSLAEINTLQTLRELNLRSSNIAQFGLGKLGKLKNLTILNLDFTGFTDEGMKEIHNFPNLTTLSLESSEVSNVGMKELRGLKNLLSLNLSSFTITDAGLKELSQMTTLRELDLTSTNITDAGVAELKNLTELTAFSVGGEKITDASIQVIGGMKNLITLELPFSRITEKGMQQLRDHRNLRVLSFHWAMINDECMKVLPNFTDLESLDLTGARISDGSMDNLKGLTHLTNLDLRDTRINGTGLQAISGLTNLTKLDLASAAISDADIKELSGMKKLKELDLFGTAITDAGLPELSRLKDLTHLMLRHTQITNNGLTEFQKFKKLQQLDVANTRVSDDGLEDLLKLKYLNALYIAKGQFSQKTLDQLQKRLPTLYVTEW